MSRSGPFAANGPGYEATTGERTPCWPRRFAHYYLCGRSGFHPTGGMLDREHVYVLRLR